MIKYNAIIVLLLKKPAFLILDNCYWEENVIFKYYPFRDKNPYSTLTTRGIPAISNVIKI